MDPPTQPVLVEDRKVLRTFLEGDPVVGAVVWDRVYGQTDYTRVCADALPPKAVLALAPERREGGVTMFALHATDVAAAQTVFQAVPPGPAFFHLAEEWALGLVEPRAEELQPRIAWLLRLHAGDFVDAQRHETRPVPAEAAPLIAKLWEPDWPSEAYVRRRIEGGPTAGIFVKGELVAWGMTHFFTERVGMMGFLHVLDGHRGQGYAKSVTSALAKEILARGKVPALHVYADNVASLELCEDLGFRRVRKQVWGDGVLR